MRIEFAYTRSDWQDYLRFITLRTGRPQRKFWIALLSFAFITAVVFFALSPRGLHGPSALAGVAFVLLALVIITRLNRSAAGIPDSWTEPRVCALLEDGIHTHTSVGYHRYEWRVIREVQETDEHLFLLLDNYAYVLPKRALDAVGGSALVRAEIERRIRDAIPAPDSVAGAYTVAPSLPVAGQASESAAWLALPRNLWAGLRLTTFLPVNRGHFAPSARQAVLLAMIAVALWVGLDRLRVTGPAELVWYAVAGLLGIAAFGCAALLLLAPRAADASTRLSTAMAAASPFLVLIGFLPLLTESEMGYGIGAAALLLMAVIALYRAHRIASDEHRVLAVIRTLTLVLGVIWVFDSTLYARPEFWYSTEQTEESTGAWDATESELFRQPGLVDAALERVQQGEAGRTETYFVGFAGYGAQRVFDKEVRFARDALARRLDLEGRTLELINTPQPDASTPLATVSGLRRALAGVAERMNVEEDVLVLFLTSHGDENAELSVTQGVLPLEGLRGPALRSALDEAGIRWRIIVISACHSGSFIPHLEDPYTLVATAARADRSSFGCTDERELTYFGEALFRDALPGSTDLLDAMSRAKEIVREHEAEEKIATDELSEPQLFVGERMRAKLSEVEFRTAS